MGVIYIGDRATGKTHLLLELANPQSNYAQIINPDYQSLMQFFYDRERMDIKPTGSVTTEGVYDRYIEIQVELPTGKKKITLDWLDTPGEIWRESWQKTNPSQWKTFLETIKLAEGILLIIPPYRDMILPNQANPDDFITKKQWCIRFERWVQFFRQDCPKIRHLLICLNKADLFCPDLPGEAKKLAYKPYRSPMTWQQRDQYVFQRYFRPVHPQINQLNGSIQGLSVRCFITSIKNRELLELPWIYLGSFLEKSTI